MSRFERFNDDFAAEDGIYVPTMAIELENALHDEIDRIKASL